MTMGLRESFRRAMVTTVAIPLVGLGALAVTVPLASSAEADQLCVGPNGNFVACGQPGQAPVIAGSTAPGSSSGSAASGSSPFTSPAGATAKAPSSKHPPAVRPTPARTAPVRSDPARATGVHARSSGRSFGLADTVGVVLVAVDLLGLGAVLQARRRRARRPAGRPVRSPAVRTSSASTAGLP